jgi:hypothetical protein
VEAWKPKLDEEKKPSEYHECLNTALYHSQTDLAAAVVEAATSTAAQRPRPRCEHNAEVQALFEQRRDEDDPERRKQISKQLWKALRRQRRQRVEEDIDDLARTGAGRKKMKLLLQKQSGVQQISKILNKDGELQHDPSDMAEVFAQFYEYLYKELGGRNVVFGTKTCGNDTSNE